VPIHPGPSVPRLKPLPDPYDSDLADVPELDPGLFDDGRDGRVDADAIEAAFVATVARYPEAPVVALGDDGIGTKMPDSVPHRRSNLVGEVRAALDVVAYDAVLLQTWERTLTYGVGRCRIRLVRTPDATGTNFMFDLREGHGVIVVVSVMDTATDAGRVEAGPDSPEVAHRPRFATIVRDAVGVVIRVDDPFTAILGWDADEVVGHRLVDRTHPDDQQLAIEHWTETQTDPELPRRVRMRHRHKDGSWVWCEVTNHNRLADAAHGVIVTELLDITEEMATLDAVRARESLLTQMADTIPVGLLQIDAERRVVYRNASLVEITGLARAAALDDQLGRVMPHDRPKLDDAVSEVLRHGSRADLEVAIATDSADQRLCTVSVQALLTPDGKVRGALLCVIDVTESTRMREELRRRATYDDLTGCHNRASVMRAIEDSISEGGRRGSRAVVYADLDGFKQINDRDGHAAGDELLRSVAERLRAATRDGDIVGRIGGDEFLVLCPQVGSEAEAIGVVDRIRTELDGGARISIGVAWSTGDALDADALVAKADAAMYAAKRGGGDSARLAA
jgi:diguanylate cyclase (GGDEF)-like protein/PAS domain S-box-containing protein